MVAADGVTDGLALVEVKLLSLLIHAYVLPVTAVPPMLMDEPAQIEVPAITEAAGSAFTVTDALADVAVAAPFVTVQV
jgi:hypothetical protein